MITLKRIYDPSGPDDGFRILVDRLWPRGMSKAKAKVDLWLKDIAPSPKLRQWFGHDPAKWGHFWQKYWAELEANTHLIKQIRDLEKEYETVTLLYAAKDEQHNHARVLKEFLTEGKPESI